MNDFAAALFGLLCLLLLGLYRLGGRANRVDWGRKWLNHLEGINRLFCTVIHHLSTSPLVLPEGRLLLASNHLSGLDPLLLLALANRPLRFMIAREEYERWWLRWLLNAVDCIPVDRRGQPDKVLSQVRKALEAGEVVVIFPQGGIQQPDQTPRPLKRGVALLACITDSPVLPVRINNIRGAGRTLSALVLPGYPEIQVGGLLICQNRDQKRLMAQISAYLSTATKDSSAA